MRKWLHSLTTFAAIGALFGGASALAAGVGTAFTYQGQLQDAGSPATGTWDFDFRLYNAASGGAQVGADVFVNDAAVNNGLFTVPLDFGSVYDGTALWLEIGVRPGASGGAYTILTPRQSLTAAPFALYALNDAHWISSGTAIQNRNNGFVGINRTTKITGSEYFGINANTTGFAGMYINTTPATGTPFYGYSVGDGADTAWTEWNGSTKKWAVINNGTRLTIQDDGNVGIGTTGPTTKLEVNATGSTAIKGTTSAGFSYGVYGSGSSAGVYGTSGASDGAGVLGNNDATTGTGVWGESSGGGGAGVAGYDNFGTGVYGQTSSGYGVYGSNGGNNSTGYAGYFNGRLHVNGTLSKNSGSFKIDHPLDPANKYLYHSFVESPDMMNIYNGVAVLDASGNATITLPDWFEALNKDFRYQLTAIGAPAPNLYVAQEVSGNHFAIAGGQSGQKVSWQVTGIRHDAYADAHRIPVEEDKTGAEHGKYLHPELFGADDSLAVDFAQREFARLHAAGQSSAAAGN